MRGVGGRMDNDNNFTIRTCARHLGIPLATLAYYVVLAHLLVILGLRLKINNS